MTQGFPNQRPFSTTVVKHNTAPISGGSTGFMITRAPWQTGSNKYYVIRKLTLNNATTIANSGAPLLLNIWDTDLSNTSPVARGSSATPLMSIPIPFNISGNTVATYNTTNNMIVLGRDQLPAEYFQAGITVSVVQAGSALAGISGATVSLELDVI